MRFLFAFALLAVANAASYLRPTPISQELQEIIAAIQSPSTHPVTAAALEAHLLELLGISNPNYEPVSVGPAIVDFDHVEPVEASPAVVPPAASSSPLVQIVVNIDQASSAEAAYPIRPTPVIPSPGFPDVVQVVDHAPVDPVQIVDVMPAVPILRPERLN